LILAGPPGWIVFLFLASRSSGDHLSVELPYSDAAYSRFVHARRLRTTTIVVGSLGVVALLVLSAWAGLELAGFVLTLALIGVATIVLLIAEYRLGTTSVGVSIDASRRWVTLLGVHPAFVSACAEQERQRTPTAH
jgi:hypothetical protein